jgi:LysR family transcriptional regulator, nitrogen assimilation regulatory protein
MDTRRLYSFVRVVDAGSITRAADLLHIAQPALSQQMTALESLFGQQLLSRSKQGVEPTEAGRVLYRHARVILRQLEQAQADVEVVGRELAGGVSVGLAPYSTVNALALPLLSAVRARYPRVLLHINENFGGVLSEALMTGRMDMALLYDSGPIRGVDFERLLTEELVVVAPHGIELPARPQDPVSMADLADVPLLLPGPTHTIRRVVDKAFAQASTAANIVGEVESVSLMARAVRGGLGATVLPRSVAGRMIGGDDLHQRRLLPALEVQVSLGTASGQTLSRAAEAVRELLREVLSVYVAAHLPGNEPESPAP